MPTSQRRRLRALVATVGAALIATSLTPIAAQAAEPAKVIINEAYVYGSANPAPVYSNRFVELYNAGGTAQDLSGWSLQYRKADWSKGGTVSAQTLTGSIAPGGYYLISLPGNAAGTTPIAGADLTSTSVTPSGTAGTLWLASTTAKLDLPVAAVGAASGLVDLVGYGSSDTFETKGAPEPGSKGALQRTNFADTNDNSADFTLGAPTPQGSKTTPTPQPTTSPSPSPSVSPTPSATPTDPATTVTPIAQIQGTGAESPLKGKSVTTTGVVTAAYATGGFDGFYLQTAGTGGTIDFATHTASDAIFVYGLDAAKKVKIGDTVQVTGTVDEFYSLTQIKAANADAVTILPAATAPTAAKVAFPATDAQRESLEGMLIAPQGSYTVSNTYSTNQYAEVGLASGTKPLIQPTEIARPGTDAYKAAVADNAARAVTLDDGASINFLGSADNKAIKLPYLTDATVSVGAAVTFAKPVILDYRNSAWKFQPTAQLVAGDAKALPATFSNVRRAQAPAVGGNVQIASFNVLNYFPTTGADYTGGSCTYYTDRAGNNITVNTCANNGPRGAADQANLKRQQDKIVAAINGLGADVVSLEEIENSVKFGKNRDAALSQLVGALNAALGWEQWAFVPSPAADKLIPTADQDVIRTAFIYKKDVVSPVGDSAVLNDAAFANARQPLAQAFAVKGKTTADFVAIVNHFKSKGSGTGADLDQGDGQGYSNASRVKQANALVAFANAQKTAAETSKVFLLGDFNSYSQEDPVKVITDAGYTQLGASEFTYSFSGLSGSLDHVFASPDAATTVTGAHVWNINSGESLALEYSRYNYNATNFYKADAFRSSDHDPLIVGMQTAGTTTLNLLNINDFHGRIDANTVKFAGTIEQQRAAYGDANSLFLSAGDNVGASLFASATQDDKPTLDVLNALELSASATGNHEFDKGYEDLVGRIAKDAKFPYLAANVYKKGTTTPALPEYQIVTAGNGLKVAVIGALTQETPTLVSPANVATLDFGDPVDAVNRVAKKITDGKLADVIVVEYHEGAGAGTPDGATLDKEIAAGGVFAKIVTQTSPSVAAIFTGHTHKQYVWNAPVGTSGKTRPIVQTGNYGEFIGQVVLNIDSQTKQVLSYDARNVSRTEASDSSLTSTYPRVKKVDDITKAALAYADKIGSTPVGKVTADITTSFAGGTYGASGYAGTTTRDNRAGQSTLGNLVADSLVSSLKDPSAGGAQIGVVNPGGLRAELYRGTDGTVTYAQANAVLPFVNNLWTTSLTGAQFVQVLEEQWQTDDKGQVPSRPYLQLGLSSNVSYTYDASAAQGKHITGVWIDGKAIDPAASYRVGSFSFLLQGGDNFRTFAKGTGTRDSGLIDRDAWISYISKNSPLSPAFSSRKAEVKGAPTAAVKPGDTVSFTVGGIDLTSLGAPLNTTAKVAITGSTVTIPDASFQSGTATVSFTVPADAPASSSVVVTANSGTTVTIPLAVTTTTGGGTGTNPGDGAGTTPGDGAGTTPVAPTTIPQAPALSALTDALKNVIRVAAGTLTQGAQIQVFVGTQYAGAWVHAFLYSTPTSLGWHQVSPTGYITVTLPTGLEGTNHRIVVVDAQGNVIGWQAVTVLAATGGANPVMWLPIVALLTLAGAGLVAISTRRRRDENATAGTL